MKHSAINLCFFVFTFDEAEADDGPGRAEAEHQLPLETAHVGPAGLLVQT